jgi:hypothetical protein
VTVTCSVGDEQNLSVTLAVRSAVTLFPDKSSEECLVVVHGELGHFATLQIHHQAHTALVATDPYGGHQWVCRFISVDFRQNLYGPFDVDDQAAGAAQWEIVNPFGWSGEAEQEAMLASGLDEPHLVEL